MNPRLLAAALSLTALTACGGMTYAQVVAQDSPALIQAINIKAGCPTDTSFSGPPPSSTCAFAGTDLAKAADHFLADLDHADIPASFGEQAAHLKKSLAAFSAGDDATGSAEMQAANASGLTP